MRKKRDETIDWDLNAKYKQIQLDTITNETADHVA